MTAHVPDPAPSKRVEYLGEPTLAQVMRRPRWILALAVALLVAGVFAWLGQWQLGHAIRSDASAQVDTETPRDLGDVTELSEGVTDAAAAVVVELDGAFVAGDTRVVEPRDNDGESGAWVVGHMVTTGPKAAQGANLAVAIGWAPTTADAHDAIDAIEADLSFEEPLRIEGRYMPPEGPQVPSGGEDPQAMHTLVPSFLANSWASVTSPVYSGYLVLHGGPVTDSMIAAGDLDAIDSVPPLPVERVNWLNVFYAIEWVVFAGFAVFFWFRLTRDAWEKEHELRDLLEAEADAATEDAAGGAVAPDPAGTDPAAPDPAAPDPASADPAGSERPTPSTDSTLDRP